MAEQLSPGAQAWYQEASNYRAEKETKISARAKAFPKNEWHHLFDEFRMVDHATLMTYCNGDMDKETHAQISRALVTGYLALHQAQRTFGYNTDSDQVNFVTGEIQARMYIPLYQFLHPQAAKQYIETKKGDSNG
jgi:hypothetical protein